MQYDRQFADVFVVQDDIARNVLDSLRIVLTPQQKSAMSCMVRAMRKRSIFICEGSASTSAWRLADSTRHCSPAQL
jgi:hypothetical protein